MTQRAVSTQEAGLALRLWGWTTLIRTRFKESTLERLARRGLAARAHFEKYTSALLAQQGAAHSPWKWNSAKGLRGPSSARWTLLAQRPPGAGLSAPLGRRWVSALARARCYRCKTWVLASRWDAVRRAASSRAASAAPLLSHCSVLNSLASRAAILVDS